MPWRLDWHNLKSIDANAVEPLCKVFGGWSAQPVQLRFIGESQLQQVLQDATPSGARDTPRPAGNCAWKPCGWCTSLTRLS